MIEIMNEQHKHFVSEMRECGLLYETNSSLSFLGLEASLYDDYEFSNPLDSSVFYDACLPT